MAGKNKKNDEGPITAAGFGVRFLAALAMVLLTFNPSGHSAYHWIASAIGTGTFGPLHLLLIGVLLAGWAVFWIATWRALDTLGVVLASIVLGAIIWLLIDIGLLSAHSVSAATWIGLFFLAGILTIGVSWSHIWRRITGQVSVEHLDN
jgi:hypothetical protein